MNLFEYTVADKKLDTLSTVKDKLEFVRWVHADIIMGGKWNQSTRPSSNNFTELSFQHRLLTKALAAVRKAPLFIQETAWELHTKVLTVAIRSNIPAPLVEEALGCTSWTPDPDLTYDDLGAFLENAVSKFSRLSLKAKLQLLHIVRNSCEPHTLYNPDIKDL